MRIDSANVIDEVDETHNYAHAQFEWAAAPDLVVSSASASSATLTTGDTVDVSVTVRNQGTGAVPGSGFFVALYENLNSPPTVGMNPDHVAFVPPLGASSNSSVFHFKFSNRNAVTTHSYVLVDYTGSVN